MTEPTYFYKKGEGWIPSIDERRLVTTQDGKSWWFIKRQPEIGQIWDCVLEDRLESYWRRSPDFQISVWSTLTQEILDAYKNDTQRVWFTVVPV